MKVETAKSKAEIAREIEKTIQREIADGISNLTRRLGQLQASNTQTDVGDPTDDDLGVRVITLAGNNDGASMSMGSGWLDQDDHNESGFTISSNSDEVGDDNSTKKMRQERRGSVKSIVNSNVQGVNNSILFNSSCTDRDPGVHLDLSNSPADSFSNGRYKNCMKPSSSATANLMELNRTNANTSLRRRTLHALFSESSSDDSDEE
eukprot:Gb_06276 [translate_table: standard]